MYVPNLPVFYRVGARRRWGWSVIDASELFSYKFYFLANMSRRSVQARLPVLRLFFYLLSVSFCVCPGTVVHRIQVPRKVSHVRVVRVWGSSLLLSIAHVSRTSVYVFIIVDMIAYRQSLVSSIHRFPGSSANAAWHLRGR